MKGLKVASKYGVILLSTFISMNAHANWRVSSSTDEMTGETQNYAISDAVSTTRPMGFPYKDTKSWIGVGCDGKSEWVFIGFNKAPNISGDKNQNGWSLINTRFKWDNNIQNVNLSQTWGAKFIHFRGNDAPVIRKIQSSKKGLLELNWHGEGSVYFPYSFSGSSKAISTIRQKCN